MPFARPTLTDLRNQAWADMQATGSTLPVAILWCLSWAQAGLSSLHYAFLDKIAAQCAPWTATGVFLEAWAALKGVTREAASFATGTWSGTGTRGSTIAMGASIARGDGFAYVTTASATVASDTTVSVPFVAVTAGAVGNAPTGTTLTLAGASGVNAAGVSGIVTGGADTELDAAMRTRMLLAYAAPPQGGAASDYAEWALAVPGVTRAWVAPLLAGNGSVTVFTMLDVTEAAHSGFPQGTNGVATSETRATTAAGDQLAVANAIYPLRPVTALVYSNAPTPYAVNVTIANLYPSTTAMQAAVTTALQAAFLRAGSVGGTTWPVNSEGAANGTMYPSDLTDALAAVTGLIRYVLTSPSSVITAPVGGLPVLGTVTFV
jgi:uncharacterized phage protein gp47/JayE